MFSGYSDRTFFLFYFTEKSVDKIKEQNLLKNIMKTQYEFILP